MNLSYALDHQLKTKFSDLCVLRVTDGVRYFSTGAQKLCENGGGRPGLPVPNGPYGLCGRKATLNSECERYFITEGEQPCWVPAARVRWRTTTGALV